MHARGASMYDVAAPRVVSLVLGSRGSRVNRDTRSRQDRGVCMCLGAMEVPHGGRIFVEYILGVNADLVRECTYSTYFYYGSG